RRISEISGGEKQRVALARALAKEPKLLLLDEPLSALDPQLRERLQMEIRRIQRKVGITTIYVTHSQDEAFAISDRVAILEDGVVVQTGVPEELYDAPKTEFVARFLGSGNVFRGRVTSSGRGVSVVNVHGHDFRLDRDIKEGDEVRFSLKPEDVTVMIGSQDGSIDAKLLGITPQVGSYRVALSTNGSKIIAVTNDEELIKELRNALNGQVSFSFRSRDVVILDG
ncbi:ABC transporter ATP-binding protein, partial [Candidatus Thorarchaeota archaeon]